LGPDHPAVAGTRGNLGSVLHAQEKFAEAEAEHRAALAALEAALGPDHPEVATAHSNLAKVLYDQEEYAQSEAEQRAALAIYEAALGPDHPDTMTSRSDLADVVLAQGRPAEALVLAEQSWAQRGDEGVLIENRAYAASVLADALWDVEGPARDRARARQLAQEALASYREAGDPYAADVERVEHWLETHP
jgi:tetratricopeptide (TPR) repeat protein